MKTRLVDQRYGKSRVRVLKVLRGGPVHTVKELDVAVTLSGDFDSSYTDPQGDNSKVVPTDTMKNTVNLLAHEHLGRENEPFALKLGEHFLSRYPQVQRVRIDLTERVWGRLQIDGEPHPHSFVQAGNARPFVRLDLSTGSRKLESGIRDLLILKSTASGFEGFPRCEFTTLPETKDRIFATSLEASWLWAAEPASYESSRATIVAAMLKPFAENYSPSVQTTLYEMATAALAACGEISEITLAMPNKHCLLINLQPFGRENRNEVFVPTDEPHGLIEATIARA